MAFLRIKQPAMTRLVEPDEDGEYWLLPGETREPPPIELQNRTTGTNAIRTTGTGDNRQVVVRT